MVAGTSGDSGKTLVSLALLLAASYRGLVVRAFKKGPDYIDAAWLAWASGHTARNLDTFLTGFDTAVASFDLHALPNGLNLVEGNRGLYDGVDVRGTHSTAELAKALTAPVVLVVNAAKVTRTAAALVLGCQKLDEDVRLAAVILNRVSTARHEQTLRHTIESSCGIPVIGAVRKLAGPGLLPDRHLGLVTPDEHPNLAELRRQLLRLASDIDMDAVRLLATDVPVLSPRGTALPEAPDARGLTIGYLKDSAFTFYYPENLEALAFSGATLVPVSALSAAPLPDTLDALYIGGGFPETHAERLSANTTFLESLKEAVRRGLPIYAECGGLMLLSRAIRWRGRSEPMAGVLPFEVEVCATPQGHGYTELTVDRPNLFFPEGITLRGHEFHYSRILLDDRRPLAVCSVRRGTGCFEGRDGIVEGNVWASYTHLNALATPEWVYGILNAARQFARERSVGQFSH